MNERLEELANDFFSRVIRICPSPARQVDYVVVTHLLEDRPWFLKAVSQLGRVVAVIPKRKSIVPRVRDLLRHQYTLLDITRSDLETEERVSQHLRRIQMDRPLCLLDIGGYFVPLVSMNTDAAGIQVAGIIEDTENGHVKYQKATEGRCCRFPIYSVARSNLKDPENFLVGQSLVFSVEAILRQLDELLHGRRASVIGYGNIGRSVARHLHERHVNVTVYDTDTIKLVEAFTHGFRTPETIQEALAESDIVFCVTGNRSIGAAELSYLRPYTYIATVTSPDDEFRMDELKHVETIHRDGYISEMRLTGGKIVYLMNRGQAVNFVHGATVGPFIQLLQAEILVAASMMLTLPRSPGIGTISTKQKQQIAGEWLQVYRH